MTGVISLAFKFRLQKVYDVRKKEEEMLKNELMNIRTRKHLLKQRLNKFADEIRRLEEEFYRKEVLTKADISLVREWLTYYKEEMNKLEEELKSLEGEEKEVLDRFLQVRKDRKILEKLKDRKLMEFLREEDRKAKKRMDEIAERRFWWST